MSDTDVITNLSEEIARTINKQVLIDLTLTPTTRLINVDKVDNEVIKDWLRSKQSSTWAIYSISSEDSLEKAASWFKSELDKFVSHLYQSS